jgi:hypothetical protein
MPKNAIVISKLSNSVDFLMKISTNWQSIFPKMAGNKQKFAEKTGIFR